VLFLRVRARLRPRADNPHQPPRVFFRAFLVCVFAVLLASGCSAPLVRAPLDDVLADPAAYEDVELIVTASVEDVRERYHLYRDRRVEVTGDLAYYGRRSFWTWYLMLADGDHRLRCYTHHYRLSVGRDAEVMLLSARAARKPVTVNGILRSDGIDIWEILYDGQLVRPDYKPPEVPVFPGTL